MIDHVDVPVTLLRNADLSDMAKLIWMVSQAKPAEGKTIGPGWLSAATGVARWTVHRHLPKLAAIGNPPGETVPVPTALLTNRRLGTHARVLFGLLRIAPGFSNQFGQITYTSLAALAHASRNTVARGLDQLIQAEWVKVERKNRFDQIRYELTFPGMAHALNALAALEDRLAGKKPYGEYLMREYLTLLIDSERYEDNANPGFLVNPRTGALLQFDRFYAPHVAFEFQGPQHDRATELYDEQESRAQQERDLIKQGICVREKITLVTVYPDDLTLASMQKKVGNLLPLRDLTEFDLCLDYLEMESRRYRRRVARF